MLRRVRLKGDPSRVGHVVAIEGDRYTVRFAHATVMGHKDMFIPLDQPAKLKDEEKQCRLNG